ncbi:DUF1656 domain-containing protein [Pseudomonas sp. CFSAN084952]|uniref:DUF1656 domain-containing protein n=1 Tax=Pseudomonas sp. CFSAN084952 TaxID=2664899 RepID=UPI001299F620|nr:DUF1656 domain-containing protein [Pseudomonas sp. CFSAN084952]
MLSEFSIAGVYIPPFLLYVMLAWPVFLGVRKTLTYIGVFRNVWHPALVEIAILIGIVALLILYV